MRPPTVRAHVPLGAGCAVRDGRRRADSAHQPSSGTATGVEAVGAGRPAAGRLPAAVSRRSRQVLCWTVALGEALTLGKTTYLGLPQAFEPASMMVARNL